MKYAVKVLGNDGQQIKPSFLEGATVQQYFVASVESFLLLAGGACDLTVLPWYKAQLAESSPDSSVISQVQTTHQHMIRTFGDEKPARAAMHMAVRHLSFLIGAGPEFHRTFSEYNDHYYKRLVDELLMLADKVEIFQA